MQKQSPSDSDFYGYQKIAFQDRVAAQPARLGDTYWRDGRWFQQGRDPLWHPDVGAVYRRPLPLGNAPGAAPLWRLVQWQEQIQPTDDITYDGVHWVQAGPATSPCGVGYYIEHGSEMRAVRRRVATATEAAPAAPAQRSADNASFACCPRCGGPRHCRVCEREGLWISAEAILAGFQQRGWDTTLLPLDFTVAQLCDWITALSPEPKACGEWVLTKDKTPPLELLDQNLNVIMAGGSDGCFCGYAVRDTPSLFRAWLRPFPKPAPPPLPAPEPCCDEWDADLDKEYGPFKFCPDCGKPRPAAKEAAA